MSGPPEAGRPPLRGLFVTGTDTEVGKTYLAAALCAALRARGERVVPFKPVVTGTDDPGPTDHQRLGAAAGVDPATVTPHAFGPPVAPHLAAAQAGVRLDLDAMVAAAREAATRGDVLIVEGVGGLLVPLDGPRTIRDLAVALGLPLLVVARPGLGTINHTLLTLEAARAAGLEVRGVVLTPWTGGDLQEANLEAIERLGGVAVSVLAPDSIALAPDLWLGDARG